MNIILRILVAAIAVCIAAYLIPGVVITDYFTAIVVVVVLAIVNGFIGTALRIMTLPLNIISLGLVSFIIGVLMILLTDALVGGFSVGGIWGAILFSIVLSLVNLVFGVGKSDLKD
jgi:putative membrane protein